MVGYIPTISKARIENLIVPLPKTLYEQLEIGNVFEKMKNLKHSVDNLQLSYLENPMEINDISDILNNALEVFGGLGIEDRIKNIIKKGENKHS